MRLTILAVLLFVAAPAAAQQRPLVTEDPETVGAGRVLLEGGIDYSRDILFPASGLTGNLLRAPLVGLPAASVIFGAVHIGGRNFVAYGVWAACIGALFGWLMVMTGGLLAPIVAHAVYDALALAFVRYRPGDLCD